MWSFRSLTHSGLSQTGFDILDMQHWDSKSPQAAYYHATAAPLQLLVTQASHAAAHSLNCTRYSNWAPTGLQCDIALCAAAVQAVWVSDCILGARLPETRAAFISQLQQVSVEASPEDVQWMVSRPTGNAEASSGPQLFKGPPVPPTAPAAAPDARRAIRATTDSSSQAMSLSYACFCPGPSSC